MQTLGPYRVVRRLAAGGMGEVFLARAEGPGGFARDVVVKRILPHLAQDRSYVAMFLNEARLAARLTHPNIVSVVELGEDEGAYYLAMEYLHGRTLRSVRNALREQQARMNSALAAYICSQVLHGLHYAHTLVGETGLPLGLVHRDISPDNVMLGYAGYVKLLDFGLAKATDSDLKTRTGSFKGKFEYVSPEQLRGAPLDARADLYAVGVTLFECLAGERPVAAHTLAQPPSDVFAALPGDVPPELRVILERALAYAPTDRFESAATMAKALETFLATSRQTAGASELATFLTQLFPHDVVHAPEEPLDSQAGGGTFTAGPIRAPVAPESPTLADSPEALSRRPAPLLSSRTKKGKRGLAAAVAVLIAAGSWIAFSAREPALPLPVAPPDVVHPSPVVATAPPVAGPVELPPQTPTRAPLPRARATRHAPAKKPLVKVTIRVNPWAEVWVGNRRYGVTPLSAPLEFPAGPLTLVLKNPELKISRRVPLKLVAGNDVMVLEDLLKK